MALIIQHACNANTPQFSVICPALQYFSILSHKRQGFRENVTEHKMCVLSFSTTFVRSISLCMKK